MLTVKTPEEVLELIENRFTKQCANEEIDLINAVNRVLAQDVIANEYVPDYNRSTVDGYAVVSGDTFGCSESIPAILSITGEVFMGASPDGSVNPGECMIIPTGGAVPDGADAVVMVEYTESYGDGTIGVFKSAAPGINMIYRGDDVYPGKTVLKAGRKLTGPDIGALAALGISTVTVVKQPVIGIISTGDELVDIGEQPSIGQTRDVNSYTLNAFCVQSGAIANNYGIIRDEEELLDRALDRALKECDMVLISGGSSVGTKDATYRVISSRGEMLLHGIAVKPGKPTIMGICDGKPVVGLPGHPAAAYYVSEMFVAEIVARLQGRKMCRCAINATLSETIGANHGRTQCSGVVLRENQGVLYADPIHSKSGLISSLSTADGYFVIERDSEGVSAGATIEVYQFDVD